MIDRNNLQCATWAATFGKYTMRVSRMPEGGDLGLSKREWCVLKAMILGLSQKEIARDMGVSLNTIQTYRNRIYVKLGVQKASSAVAIAAAYLGTELLHTNRR